MGEKTGRDVR